MAWSGGTFTRTNGVYTGSTTWATDEANSVNIESARHDTHDQDLATGINTCLTKDGQNSPSAHLNWVNTEYYASSTGGTANAITIALTNAPGAYYAGMKIAFTASSTNTASMTANVNSLGAKTCKRTNGDTLYPGDVTSGNTYHGIYDGTDIIILDVTPTWNSWTPTLDAKLSSETINIAKYTVIDKVCHYILSYEATKDGSTTNNLTATLPIACASGIVTRVVGSGFGGSAATDMVVAYTSASATTTVNIRKYDASNYTNSVTQYFRLSGSYEIA